MEEISELVFLCTVRPGKHFLPGKVHLLIETILKRFYFQGMIATQQIDLRCMFLCQLHNKPEALIRPCEWFLGLRKRRRLDDHLFDALCSLRFLYDELIRTWCYCSQVAFQSGWPFK